MENVAEDFLPFLGIRQKQLQEVTLGDHSHLGKLFPVKAQDLFDGSVDVPELGDHPAVGIDQPCIGSLLGHAVSPALGTHVLGVPDDGIFLACITEGQFHFGGCGGISIFGAKHARLPVAAAGFSEESKADGIEEGGLAGTGVAGDQIQTAGTKAFKIQFHPAGIGAEGRYGQFQRSHFSPSQMDSIRSCK